MAVFDVVKDYVKSCKDSELENLISLVSRESVEREANRKKTLWDNMILAIKEYRNAFPNEDLWVGYSDDSYYDGEIDIEAGEILDELVRRDDRRNGYS